MMAIALTLCCALSPISLNATNREVYDAGLKPGSVVLSIAQPECDGDERIVSNYMYWFKNSRRYGRPGFKFDRRTFPDPAFCSLPGIPQSATQYPPHQNTSID